MRSPCLDTANETQRGFSLVEVLIALVVLSIGILAVSRLFPAGSKAQLNSRLLTSASYYVEQKAEELQGASTADPALSIGRHPAGTATEALGSSGAWHRYYQVDQLTGTLSNIRRAVITVEYGSLRTRAVTDTIYLRR